jgi:Xaa-Pro dipeptidase
MDEAGLAAALITAPANQTYLTGFRALLYSRPIILLVFPHSTALIVPALEEVHARDEAGVDEVIAYFEHPHRGGSRDAVECLDQHLAVLPTRAEIGIEFATCPAGMAQHLAVAGHRPVDVDQTLRALREVKDLQEIAHIREAARVTGTGVAASLDACRAGTTEIEVDGAGTAAVMVDVARLATAATVEQLIMTPSGRERTTLPHVLSTTRHLAREDGLIHTRQVGLNGYRAELERTAFVGPPDAEQRRLFELMSAAQRAAIERVAAGVPCCEVDRAARVIFEDAGLGAFAVHRSGHGIGLSPHEPPYLRYDNTDTLEEGMVITVEPGIYIPGVGGFRHSDTLLVHDDGFELLTSHAADLDSLVLDA